MKCERCGEREASVHVSSYVNGQLSQSHLCGECMKVMQPGMPGFSINELIAGFLGDGVSPTQKPDVRCPRCGLDYQAFRKSGTLGCAQCYTAFRPQLKPLLGRIHGSAVHKGRVPAGAGEENKARRELEKLKGELSRAVLDEQYERAAELRDKIRGMEDVNHG